MQQTIEQKVELKKQQKITPKSHLFFFKLLHLDRQKLFSLETSHIVIMYFALHGLNSLKSFQLIQNPNKLINKQNIQQYIMTLYLPHQGGFTCSSLYKSFDSKNQFLLPHIVFTYSALNCLYILGSLSKVDKQSILKCVSRCQKDDGSFSNFQNSSQADLRFVYAALSVCNILQDFSFINKQKAIDYIQKCFNFDGGFGLRPYCQSHSGAIYCAIASLNHMKVQLSKQQKRRILRFLVNRQTFHKEHESLIGVQGRVGKLPDSCYSYWVGASIEMLIGKNLLNPNIENFLMACYNQSTESFAKFPSMKGDPMHTLHSNIGLKIIKEQLGYINLAQGIQMKY